MEALRLGCSDWRWGHWNGVFYPADLPEDWRLTFYNTQYSCVWLPLARWRGISHEEAKRWVEDTHADFRFLLERPVERPTPEDEALWTLLRERLGAVCGPDDPCLYWFSANPDLKGMADRLRGGDRLRYLLNSDGDLASLEAVSTLLGLLGL